LKEEQVLVMSPGFFFVTLAIIGLIAVFGVLLLPLVCVVIFGYSMHRLVKYNEKRV